MSDTGPASYGEAFSRLFTEIKNGLAVQYSQQSFMAEVVSYDASLTPVNYAVVRRYDSAIEEGPYRVAGHVAALVAGDRVKVEDVTGEGGYVVSYLLPL